MILSDYDFLTIVMIGSQFFEDVVLLYFLGGSPEKIFSISQRGVWPVLCFVYFAKFVEDFVYGLETIFYEKSLENFADAKF